MFGLKELRSRATGVKKVLVIPISLGTLWSLTIYGVNERWNRVLLGLSSFGRYKGFNMPPLFAGKHSR